MDVQIFQPSNGAGWRLWLKRAIDPEHFNPRLRPVVIIPGYGINSFIFGYHPTGVSMVEYLAAQGLEVWSVNLRAQDHTISEGGGKVYGIRDIALSDVPAAIDCALENTQSRRRRPDVIGGSLGGTYVYTYLALRRDNPVASVIGLGAPLRWEEINPILRVVFSSPRLARALRLNHTRSLARYGLPLAARIPRLIHIYLHPEIVDLSRPDLLVKTVENPNPQLNEEICRWMINKDLIIDGINISERFREVTNPLYCMLANGDGIVPPATALSALALAGSKVKEQIIVGTDDIRMAHADMFICRYAQEFVFEPMAAWLLKQNKIG